MSSVAMSNENQSNSGAANITPPMEFSQFVSEQSMKRESY